MRKLVLAASMALLLTACSAPQQEQLNFAPRAELSNSNIVNGSTFSLTSKDVRSAQYVALVDRFQSQGFRTSVNSDNSIVLQVQEMLVSVKHSVMENEMDAKLVIELTAETPKGKLVKLYTATANRNGALSASNEEIELVLNDVANLALREIANDRELQSYMQERF